MRRGSPSRWSFEANLFSNGVRQALEHATMLVEDANDLRHLRFDTGEAFVRLAFVLRLKAVGFRHASDKRRLVGVKCRLILDEHGHGVFKPFMAVRRWSFSWQRTSLLVLGVLSRKRR